MKRGELLAIHRSPIISSSQYDELAHKVEPGQQELCSCERYRICEELGIKAEVLSETDVDFWKRVGLSRLRRYMQYPVPDGYHYPPQPDTEGTAMCHRRFESIGVAVYQELLKPLFPDWSYQQSWGEKEAELVVDRVEAYHKEYPFMLNQLRLIPDSVILNSAQGASFQRPKSACNFVNQLLRMAGLKIETKQIRTGFVDPETGKERRVRRYCINPESLNLVRHYAQSRAFHKQISVSHTEVNSIKIRQGVTARNHDKEGTSCSKSQIAAETRKLSEQESLFMLNNSSGNIGKSTINSE